jgi:hypothetical protein
MNCLPVSGSVEELLFSTSRRVRSNVVNVVLANCPKNVRPVLTPPLRHSAQSRGDGLTNLMNPVPTGPAASRLMCRRRLFRRPIQKGCPKNRIDRLL